MNGNGSKEDSSNRAGSSLRLYFWASEKGTKKVKNQLFLPVVRLGQYCATRGHCAQESFSGGVRLLRLREEELGTQILEFLSQYIFGGSISCVLVLDGFLYPVSELAEVGVDAWHVPLATRGLFQKT